MTVFRLSLLVFVSGLFALPAAAQAVRAPTTVPTQQPGIRAPDVDPSSQAHSAIMLRLNEVEQAARRQVVVLEYAEGAGVAAETYPLASQSSSSNTNRVTALCSQALQDRFGRVVSYQRAYVGDSYFFNRIVCETR